MTNSCTGDFLLPADGMAVYLRTDGYIKAGKYQHNKGSEKGYDVSVWGQTESNELEWGPNGILFVFKVTLSQFCYVIKQYEYSEAWLFSNLIFEKGGTCY